MLGSGVSEGGAYFSFLMTLAAASALGISALIAWRARVDLS
jgi:hypothetical protein